MRALITGGQGFVGRHLRAHLEALGDEVTTIDMERDVTDVAVMKQVVEDVRPEAIYHLAAISHVGTSWEDPRLVLQVNVLGTASVLAAARATSDVTTLVVSSAEVYGVVQPTDLPLREDDVARPATPYAASKLAAEVVALQSVRGYGQRVMIARAFNHIGPGQSPTFFVPAMAQRIRAAHAEGRGSIPVGNLSSRRDFSDVRDVVRAYAAIVRHGTSGEIYNVASGVDHAMSELAEILRDAVDPSIVFETDPALLRPVDIPVLRGSADKLTAATGWTPLISLRETLADVLEATPLTLS